MSNNHLSPSDISTQYLSSKDKRLGKVIQTIGDIEYSTSKDPYSFLVHEIIEQMLSVKTGNKIYSRLDILCKRAISPLTINSLDTDALRSTGMSYNKASCIKILTSDINSGNLKLNELSDMGDTDVIKKLTSIKGIGNWTAKMYLIFVLNREDILPYEDGAFLQAYKWLYKTNDTSPKSIIKKCAKWKPYSSIAARYMYKALDSGLTKTEFHLYK